MGSLQFPFPDKINSKKILYADPCFEKIPSQDVDAVFEKAWNTGRCAAVEFSKEVHDSECMTMMEFLKQKGFHIKTVDVDYVMGKTRYFCEYISQKNEVIIYQKSIELWAASNQMEYVLAQDFILAHEYFHYLEWHKIGRTSKQYLVPMLQIGRLCLGKTGIAALSEIGANAFANDCYKYFLENNKNSEE